MPSEAFYADLTDYQFRLLATICHLTGSRGPLKASARELAVSTGNVHPKTVRRALKALETKGLICRQNSKKGGGLQSSSLIWVGDANVHPTHGYVANSYLSHPAIRPLVPNSHNNQSSYKLKDFEEKNKQNEWPSSTSIHCYWCCHKFNNVPYGIPVKHLDGKFHVFGCFCSLECAAAYNMKNYDSVDEMWERYMLINMLSRNLNHKSIVKPAPSKLSLKVFGGHMDIDEFRSYCTTSKVINVNFPPMMTLTQQIEEINEGDLSNDLKYIPIDTDRINKYKEKMKLKRSKPITNFKNTLDHAMNLKIV